MNRLLLTIMLVMIGPLPVFARARDYVKQSDAWFRSDAGRQRLENILSYQDQHGCWPKNLDTTEKSYQGDRAKLNGTFDNHATVDELRLLARAYRITQDDKYKSAFQTGINCILDAQYSNGGWPQRPQPRGYAQHITFNDGTMIGLIMLVQEVKDDGDYNFIAATTRQRASGAFERAIQCILDCQIKVDGRLTVWCAQHDKDSLEPRGARTYEHPSLSGSESAGVVRFLMRLDKPSDKIRQSVRGAVEWYEESKLTGFRFDKIDGDRKVIPDPDASPLWARFYDIKTNRPIFSGRDGIIKYDVAEIEPERRNGYSWYGSWGEPVKKDWSSWKK